MPPTALTQLLSVELHSTDSHRWAELRLDDSQRLDAAIFVATHIARHRCGGSPQYFDAWLARYEGGEPHAEDLLACLLAFVASESIGTPTAPAYQVHLEGFVAEHLWHLMVLENVLAIGDPLRVDGPDWSATDSGGDGLAVYRIEDELIFRLWESKAHTGTGSVRDVVNGACRQVDSNALRYLARFSKIGQSIGEADVQEFYGRIPDLWRDSAPQAGGGVSVSTHSEETEDCFGNFHSYWSFTSCDQRLGLVVVIEDYPNFATQVREQLWKGL